MGRSHARDSSLASRSWSTTRLRVVMCCGARCGRHTPTMSSPWPFTGLGTPEIASVEGLLTHPSWAALEVARSASSREEARQRLLPRFDIPAEVLEQWICAHYFNIETVRNYGWINYDSARFVLEHWSADALMALRVIEHYRRYVDAWAAADCPLDETQFIPGRGDDESWRSRGTWRVPPVVVDPVGLGDAPPYADIGFAPQLVEGHTRVSSLRRFARLGTRSGVPVARRHAVYVLRSALGSRSPSEVVRR